MKENTDAVTFFSLFGVLLGFLCVFPRLMRREKNAPGNTSEALLRLAQQQMREAQAKNRERAVQAITSSHHAEKQPASAGGPSSEDGGPADGKGRGRRSDCKSAGFSERAQPGSRDAQASVRVTGSSE